MSIIPLWTNAPTTRLLAQPTGMVGTWLEPRTSHVIKYFSLFIFTLAFIQSPKSQTTNGEKTKKNFIDIIQNSEQVEQLALKLDNGYSGFSVNKKFKFSEKECETVPDSLKTNPWIKADFDNNGLTDILVANNWYDLSVVCVLDKGNNKYELERITRRTYKECTFPIVKTGEHNNIISYCFQDEYAYTLNREALAFENKSLIYKYGGFIEESEGSKKHEIQEIEFFSPRNYHVKINADRTMIWFGRRYKNIIHKEVRSNFKTKLSEAKFNEIIDLLNYIDFEKLEEYYTTGWTDEQIGVLKITYDNGKTKTINDTGLYGTFGLSRAYQLIFVLNKTQKWKKYNLPKSSKTGKRVDGNE